MFFQILNNHPASLRSKLQRGGAIAAERPSVGDSQKQFDLYRL
jgi:hypothetical protein